jgi:argininosuccinate lyase
MFAVFGSSNVDLFIGGVDRLPSLGREEFAVDNLAWCAEPLRMVIGGNGANSAYILGKLGVHVRLASATGEDLLGSLVHEWLNAAGVDQAWVRRRSAAATSTTTIVSDALRRRLSFHHPGAYATYTQEDVPAGWTDGLAVLLITGYPLLQGLRPQGCWDLVAAAKAAGAVTALDIGPAIGDPVTLPELEPFFPALDYLVANEYETQLLAQQANVASDRLAGRVRPLLDLGARAVVVRQGPAGATMFMNGQAHHAPAQECEVRQTVGAGDAFNAGFLYGLAQGLSAAQSLAIGNDVAAQVVISAEGVIGFRGLTPGASIFAS